MATQADPRQQQPRPSLSWPGEEHFTQEERIALLEQEVQELCRTTPDASKSGCTLFI